MARSSGTTWLLAGGGVLAAGALVVALVLSERLPDGPVPVVWDKEACAHCSMHVGEPGFAAQLQTEDGRVLNFDDPGCLFQLLEKETPKVHAIYFHHHTEDRWLAKDEAGFIPVMPTPMGFGLAAVERTRQGTLNFEQAREQVHQERGGH